MVFAFKHFADERSDKSAEIRAAARTAYYHVRVDTVLIKRRFRFKPYYRLVQNYLI